MFSPSEVGTSPYRAEQFAKPLKNGNSYADELGKILHETILNMVPEDDPLRAKVEKKGHWRATKKYAARPLAGVWATSPYLHNNSVPTLAALLQKPQDRPKEFYIGSLNYDVINVGYKDEPSVLPKAPKFNTELKGNSNSGHNYGTDLSDAEKRALLEYLKSI